MNTPSRRVGPTASTASQSTGVLSPAGLERRLKRKLMKAQCRFLAICTPGMEPMLGRELSLIEGVKDSLVIPGGVEFSGPLELVYHTNLRLRTATRVLMRIAVFTARSYPEFYNKVRRIDWEIYIGFSPEIQLEVTAKRSRLHHASNIGEAAYDGITAMMRPLGTVPRRSESARIRVFVRFFEDECTLSIDSSGEPLYRRGYREASAKAPIRESIAAALLMAAGWEQFPVIADPLCGAGTFLTEAALLSRKIPPGANRDFAFTTWPAFQPTKWERLRSRARSETLSSSPVRLYAGDATPGALRAARANAQRAGVELDITFALADCREFNRDGQWGKRGLIIANPPYGKRISDRQSVMGLYREFGANLRRHCHGWHFGLVAADRDFVKAAGLQPESSIEFSNGGIDVAFVMGRI